ncbi:MAG: hypothetical protein V3V13_12505 [Paracoccaceae bacterium]
MRITSLMCVLTAGAITTGCAEKFTPPDDSMDHIQVVMSNNWESVYHMVWRIQADDMVFLIHEEAAKGMDTHKMAHVAGAYADTLAYMQENNFAELPKMCDAIPEGDRNTITDLPQENIALVQQDTQTSATPGCAGAVGLPPRYDQVYEAIRVAIQGTVENGVE